MPLKSTSDVPRCVLTSCNRRQDGAREMCNPHYLRWRQGDREIVAFIAERASARKKHPKPLCKVSDCDLPAKTDDLCGGHYQRQRKHGDVREHLPLRPRTDYSGVNFQEVIDALMNGEPAKDVSERIGIPQQTVNRIVQRYAPDPEVIARARQDRLAERFSVRRAERYALARETLEADPSIITVVELASRLGVTAISLAQDGTSAILADTFAERRRGAGIPTRSRPRWSRQDVVEAVRDYIGFAGDQACQRGCEIYLTGQAAKPSYSTVARYFSNWAQARDAALAQADDLALAVR